MLFDVEKFKNMLLNNTDPQELLNYLNECKCCKRHQNNRPHIYPNKYESKVNKVIVTKEGLCECECRHFARMICNGDEIIFE
jgi:hypothetical protein